MGYHAYFACPHHNDAQRAAVGRLKKPFIDAGFQVFSPGDVQTEDEEGQKLNEKIILDQRMEALKNADVIVSILDQLLPPGVKLYYLTGIQKGKLSLPMPPELRGLIAAGMQVTGVTPEAKTKGGIVLPGGKQSKDPDNFVPTTITVGMVENGIAGQALGGPVNCPNPEVGFELGFAASLRKPIIALGLGAPSAGFLIYHLKHLTPTLFLPMFESADKVAPRVLEEFKAGEEKEGGAVFEELFDVLAEEVTADLEQKIAAEKAKSGGSLRPA